MPFSSNGEVKKGKYFSTAFRYLLILFVILIGKLCKTEKFWVDSVCVKSSEFLSMPKNWLIALRRESKCLINFCSEFSSTIKIYKYYFNYLILKFILIYN